MLEWLGEQGRQIKAAILGVTEWALEWPHWFFLPLGLILFILIVLAGPLPEDWDETPY